MRHALQSNPNSLYNFFLSSLSVAAFQISDSRPRTHSAAASVPKRSSFRTASIVTTGLFVVFASQLISLKPFSFCAANNYSYQKYTSFVIFFKNESNAIVSEIRNEKERGSYSIEEYDKKRAPEGALK